MNTPFYFELINPFSGDPYVKKGHNLQKRLCAHRGVEVFRASANHFLYIHDSIIITERAGANKGGAIKIINDYLDSTTKHTATKYHAFERMQQAFKDVKKRIQQ